MTPRLRPATGVAPGRAADLGLKLVRRLAAVPHPVASTASDGVVATVVDALTDLGLDVRVERADVVRHVGGSFWRAGRVANVVADTRPSGGPRGDGSPSRPLVVVAHHDSVPSGPGAADNAVGVAAAVAVAADAAARHTTVRIVVTDGEEAGLLGAMAHSASATYESGSPAWVLNLDSRGNRGRPVVYGADAPALRALGRGPRVPCSSFGDWVYRRSGHDTDLSALRGPVGPGLNLGFVDGSAVYHTAADTADRLGTRRALRLARTAVRLARRLAASPADCPTGPPADAPSARPTPDETYFSVGWWVVRYPSRWDVALAGAALAVDATRWARSSAASNRARAGAAGAVLTAVAGGVAVGGASWAAVSRVRPEWRSFAFGDPYRPRLVRLGESLVAATVFGRLLPFPRSNPATVREQAHGARLVLAVLGVASGLAARGTAYPFSVAAAGSVVGEALLGRKLGGGGVAGVLAGVHVTLAAPLISRLFALAGLRGAGAPLALVGLATGLARSVLPPGPGTGRSAWWGLGAGVLSIAAGCALARPGERRPTHVRATYAHDLDTGRSYWALPGGRRASRDASERQARDDGCRFAQAVTAGLAWSPAPTIDVPAPALDLAPAPGIAPGRFVARLDTAEPAAVHALTFEVRCGPGLRLAAFDLEGQGPHVVEGVNPGGPSLVLRIAGPGPAGADLTLHTQGAGKLEVVGFAHSRLPNTLLPAGPLDGHVWGGRGGGDAVCRRAVTTWVGGGAG